MRCVGWIASFPALPIEGNFLFKGNFGFMKMKEMWRKFKIERNLLKFEGNLVKIYDISLLTTFSAMILHIKIYIKMAKFVKENFNIFEGNFRPNKFPNKEKIRIFQFLKVEVLFISQFGKMAEITSVESGVELQNEIKILMIRFYL